jgi:hypothetical protein
MTGIDSDPRPVRNDASLRSSVFLAHRPYSIPQALHFSYTYRLQHPHLASIYLTSFSSRSACLFFGMADATGRFVRAGALLPRAGGIHPPPEVLLSWPVPNVVDPEERGWESSILLIVVFALTFLVYIGRMWARLVVAKNAGMDDILMSVAMLPVFGLTISAILGKSRAPFVGKSSDDTKLSGYTASNGTHGTSHRRVRLQLERYRRLIQAYNGLSADCTDYYGDRAQLPVLDNTDQSLHPLFLSPHNRNLEGRFRIFHLGHDGFLHNRQHHIRVPHHLRLLSGRGILPPL